ncbi:hypothetical protein U879_02050 [Defluviimonas sp. 20V17]|uniref:Uncharacterized protein n=1 Tax=Allgaiera indica TaxID=765699 RepID=A0AAN4UUZ5_9RHOB|nr:hypothetical protein [Allgaiera indica]KDB05354.1 hypothetical protein U879_02050 [Defluviimonas sp. 20V17]GHE04800.1 hypothetical protein GCM10008024_33220 [Allgaiera indica]SDX54114.1 hypothetical protein SAMN05444006_11956 [Allgaiera indica]
MARATAAAKKAAPPRAKKTEAVAPIPTRQQTKVMIEGREVVFENLTPDQQYLFRMAMDLDEKIARTRMELDQFSIARQVAGQQLAGSLGISQGDAK